MDVSLGLTKDNHFGTWVLARGEMRSCSRSTFFDSGVVGYLDSLKWFMEVFRQRGFTFSEIYAWEVEPLNRVFLSPFCVCDFE